MEVSEHRKLFVGGLSREANEDTLREYFSRYGAVNNALVLRHKATGIGRGFGFVSFADSSMADEALRHNNHVILGRKVDVKKANPKDEGQEPSKGYCSNCNCNIEFCPKKIFVGGLPPDLSEEEFKTYFDRFGTVTDAVLIYEKESRLPRGFGFITYDSGDAVEDVLKNRYHELKNMKVEVKRAKPKDKNDENVHSFDYINYYDCYNTGLFLGGGFSYGYNTFSHYYYPYYHNPCAFVPPGGGWGSTITIPRSNLNGSSSSLSSLDSLTSGYTPSYGVCMNGWTSDNVDLTNHYGSCQQMEDNSNTVDNSAVGDVPTATKLPQIDDLSSLKISTVEHQRGEKSLKGNTTDHQRRERTTQEAVLPSAKSELNGDS